MIDSLAASPQPLLRVLASTASGRQELRDPKSGLSLPQRWLLGHLDGQSSLGELAALPGSPSADRLPRDAARLAGMGLAEDLGEPGPLTPDFAPSTQQAEFDLSPPLQTDSGRMPAEPQAGRRRPVAAIAGLGLLLTGAGLVYLLTGPGQSSAVAQRTEPASVVGVASLASTPAGTPVTSDASGVPTTAVAPPATSATVLVAAPAPAPAAAEVAAPAAPKPLPMQPSRPETATTALRSSASPAPSLAPREAPAAAAVTRSAIPAPTPPALVNVAPPAAAPQTSTAAPTVVPTAVPTAASTAAPRSIAPQPASAPAALPAPLSMATGAASPPPAPTPVSILALAPAAAQAPSEAPALRPLSTIAPVFPREGLGSRPVLLQARLSIAPNGTVSQVSFVAASVINRPFERAARTALLQWRFPEGSGERIYLQQMRFSEE